MQTLPAEPGSDLEQQSSRFSNEYRVLNSRQTPVMDSRMTNILALQRATGAQSPTPRQLTLIEKHGKALLHDKVKIHGQIKRENAVFTAGPAA